MMITPQGDQATTSPLFRGADADVVMLSSDCVQFHLHKKYLEFASGGFPSANTPTNGEIVDLAESSETLEILFQFIYPRQHPTLERMDFESVLKVAEAAEKYEVYAAQSVCQLKLRSDFVKSHPQEVLRFAADHRIATLFEHLAPIILDTPLSVMAKTLASCPSFFIKWCIWRQCFIDIIGEAAKQVPAHKCSIHPTLALEMIGIWIQFPSALATNERAFQRKIMDSSIDIQQCCRISLVDWADGVAERRVMFRSSR
ncbi:hypothetical protein BT96DRAFT_533123 [Gymnopus androsaceus JB14]|uniref:BTB domain-containing protein n=1 Tax=Gymnopus androsaceus JB14 TaxID=1447944 RepID=A0A6A4IKP2_9AGAR|nr:hypothetical protein BT96DRAFT_533123 [Gymnopus androsaceus JB14]